jgi:NADPH:quinone reductase
VRAVVMDRFEDSGKARVAEIPTPEPGEGEVLIEIAAAGVNPVDWKESEGREEEYYQRNHPDVPRNIQFPQVIGFDGAGRVAKLGSGVAGIEIGDPVMVFSDRFRGHHGTFAEYVCVPWDLVADMPKTISYEQAASIPCAAMTGYQCLFRADKAGLSAGDKVLIHGASGGIGSFTVQFAKQSGLVVAATCGSNHTEYVQDLGADVVFDSRSLDIGEQVRKWAPEGVPAIIDCVGKETLSLVQAMRAMKQGGRLVSIATLTDDGDVAADTAEAARHGFTKIWSIMNFENLRSQFRSIAALIDAGKVTMPPVEVQPMEEAGKVLRRVKEGHTRGKAVLKIADIPR